jgi:hypothetical protein
VPAGAPISYAGYSLVAGPHRARAAIDFRTSVAAAERFTSGGRLQEFVGWSDGGAVAHDITIPATDIALVARYRDAGPAPLQTTGGFGPGADKLGPRIALRRAKGRRLGGSVSDPSGVSTLRVALRSAARKGGCRWWASKSGRLARKKTQCAKPRWMKALLKQTGAGTWTWTVNLNGRLPKGRFKLVFRAVDKAGNLSTTLSSGKSSQRLK